MFSLKKLSVPLEFPVLKEMSRQSSVLHHSQGNAVWGRIAAGGTMRLNPGHTLMDAAWVATRLWHLRWEPLESDEALRVSADSGNGISGCRVAVPLRLFLPPRPNAES